MAKISKSTLDNAEKKKNRLGTVFVSKATNPRLSSFSYTLENLIYDPVILFVPAELVSYLSAVRDVITNFANTLYKIQQNGLMQESKRISLFMLFDMRTMWCIELKVVLHISSWRKARVIIFRFNLYLLICGIKFVALRLWDCFSLCRGRAESSRRMPAEGGGYISWKNAIVNLLTTVDVFMGGNNEE